MATTDEHISFCSIVSVDQSSLWYHVCETCERVLPDSSPLECKQCTKRSGRVGTRCLYKLMMSIATEDKVRTVVVFDRAAQFLMGAPADDFYKFACTNPDAAKMAEDILKGEMVRMVLKQPRNGYAQQMRAVVVEPLSSSFQPVMKQLKMNKASG